MSVQNTWHIILLGSFVFNCISKREGAGGKRLLIFVQEEEIRYKERKTDCLQPQQTAIYFLMKC